MPVGVFIGTAGSQHKEAEGELAVKKLRLQYQLHPERSLLRTERREDAECKTETLNGSLKVSAQYDVL